MIIALTGHQQAGKDTAANYLVYEYDYTHIKFAGRLKQISAMMFGWTDDYVNGPLKDRIDPKWGISPRQFQQFLGDVMKSRYLGKFCPEFDRINGDSFWVRVVEEQLVSIQNDDIVVSDLRFPQEYDMLRRYGATIVRIVRPGFENHDKHWSESFIDKMDVDFQLTNDNTVDKLYVDIDSLLFKVGW